MMRSLNLISSVQALPRDLRLLFLSLFLWTFGLGVYNYVWSIYLRELGASAEEVGLVFSIGFVAAALTMLPGGILANKYELRTLLIISWALSLPPQIIFYYAKSWTQAIPGLIILQLTSFSFPALNAYIAGAGDREKLSSDFGTVLSAAPLGIVFSPAVGSILLNWFSIQDLFLIAFAFFAISTVVLFSVRRQPPTSTESNPRRVELPKSSLEIVILVFLTGAAVAYSVASPFLPLYFIDVTHLSKPQVQLMGATQSFGGAVFAIFLGRRAVGHSKGRVMALGLILVALGMLGLAGAGSPLVALPMVFFLGGGRAPSLVAYSILSGIRKGGSRAGMFGFYLTLEQLGWVVGSYLGGPLYAIRPVFVLVASSLSFATLAVLSVLRIKPGLGTSDAQAFGPGALSQTIQTQERR